MVHCGQAAFTIVFKHWEVDNPQRRPFGFVGDVQVFTQFQTQRAHRVGNYFLVVGTEENHVAVLCTGTCQNRFHNFCVQELSNWAGNTFQTFRTFGDFDVSQAFRAVNLDKVTVIVDLLTAQRSTARYTQSSYAAFRIVCRTREHCELNVFHQIGNVNQLHRVTQVWFIGTVTTLSFGKGHDREITQIHPFNFQPQITHQRFHHFTHLRCGHEGSLNVDLGKFRLTVST